MGPGAYTLALRSPIGRDGCHNLFSKAPSYPPYLHTDHQNTKSNTTVYVYCCSSVDHSSIDVQGAIPSALLFMLLVYLSGLNGYWIMYSLPLQYLLTYVFYASWP
jgi:hypothetical protein